MCGNPQEQLTTNVEKTTIWKDKISVFVLMRLRDYNVYADYFINRIEGEVQNLCPFSEWRRPHRKRQ